jgi:type I restriction enzyme S subunit
MRHPCVALAECCEFLDHIRKPVKESERVNGPYPYFGANGQQGWINGYLFDEPLVLLAEDGGHFSNPERGIAYKINGKTWVNNHAHVLRPIKGIVDVDYLAHALKNKDVRRHLSGSTRDKLTKAGACQIEIPLPPLEEQRRIAAILDASQKLQSLHRLRIDGLFGLRQSMYQQLFALPGSEPLPLSSLAKITSGYAFKAADFCEQGVHVIRMSDLSGEDVDLASSALVPAEVIENLERFELFEGDILLGMSGSLGKLGIVPCIPAGARVFLNQRVAKISLLPSSPISRELLVEAIKSKEYIGHLERCAAGVAVRNVSSTQMLDFLIPVLTEEEGQAFSTGCRTVSAQILRSEHCIAQSRELQASLVEVLLGQS